MSCATVAAPFIPSSENVLVDDENGLLKDKDTVKITPRSAQSALASFFYNASAAFQALEAAKLVGWESSELDTVFTKCRSKATCNIQRRDTSEMRYIMQAVMREIDEGMNFAVSSNTKTFLDVCAAPGGFSAYLLEAQPECVGMGVTLPYSKGGHPMGITDSGRYTCEFTDVLKDPSEIIFRRPTLNKDGSPGYGLPIPHSCDLVILDGHFLGGEKASYLMPQGGDLVSYPTADFSNPRMDLVSKETEHQTKLMWISQLLISIQNLKQGGTLIFRSSTKPDLVQISMLCMVSRLFKGKIRPIKPTVCHMMRSSFYVVCQGFDLGAASKMQIFPKILFLWSEMKGTDTGDFPIWHPIDQLSEFGSPQQFIRTWGPALVNFLEPVWRFQTLALKAMIQDCASSSPRMPKDQGCKSKMCFYYKLGQCKRNSGACWYAHEVEELHPTIRKACTVRFLPLVAPWLPHDSNTKVL
eukprot:TRINITY_DN447_c1_g1_i1.p1 TRINITY_DN447_c1_g1~~TRINITY_DN447_c1_g1_i1.p1  ORF type:complete len:469 (-),score=56.41 TRINITY_DN447_c1_g1_i1:654-2060(-)